MTVYPYRVYGTVLAHLQLRSGVRGTTTAHPPSKTNSSGPSPTTIGTEQIFGAYNFENG